MSSNLALVAHEVSKRYMLNRSQPLERAESGAGARQAEGRGRAAKREEFWSLRDVSFSVEEGEVLGIIGRNGAGKSTLLKILSRITAPTSGTVDIYGRVGSLLEVGTGFHPELTGRENIFLNGAVLGMTRRQTLKNFSEIVEFSGVEKFLETPVKRYSSGMYIRLAFAVAAHLDAAVLLIDEVLAVGDADFQERCLTKMRDVSASGRTVVFVSHQLASVRSLCSRAIYLENGSVLEDGSVDNVINKYLQSFAEAQVGQSDASSRPGSGTIRLESVRMNKDVFSSAEEKDINFTIPASTQLEGKRYFLAATITDRHGNLLSQIDSRLVGWWGDPSEPRRVTMRLVTPWLRPGKYRVDAWICDLIDGIVDEWQGAAALTVGPSSPYEFAAPEDSTALGLTFAKFDVFKSEDIALPGQPVPASVHS